MSATTHEAGPLFLHPDSPAWETPFYWRKNNEHSLRSKHIATEGDVELVRSWMGFCFDDHTECQDRELQHLRGTIQILLIDAKTLCLVNALTSYRYLALSYVWGQVVQYQTTGSTLDGLLLPESLKLVWNEIPKVIRDAIDFTDRIGERYLWVDSLCIVQDAPSKHMQIQHMAEIYNSATMTLMACVGKKADDALRLISPVRPKRPKRPTEISYTDTSSSEDDGEYHLDDQEAQGAQDGLPRKSRPLQIPQRPSKEMQQEIKMEIARSHHNSRGWTYQEPQTAVDDEELHLEWPEDLDQWSWESGFALWTSIVEEYSCKQLSFQEDVLDACCAVFHTFEKHTGWTAVQGVPLPLFEIALLWIPQREIARRATKGQQAPAFPSWSWSGWSGGVSFRMTCLKPEMRAFDSQLEDLYLQKRGSSVTLEEARSTVTLSEDTPASIINLGRLTIKCKRGIQHHLYARLQRHRYSRASYTHEKDSESNITYENLAGRFEKGSQSREEEIFAVENPDDLCLLSDCPSCYPSFGSMCARHIPDHLIRRTQASGENSRDAGPPHTRTRQLSSSNPDGHVVVSFRAEALPASTFKVDVLFPKNDLQARTEAGFNSAREHSDPQPQDSPPLRPATQKQHKLPVSTIVLQISTYQDELLGFIYGISDDDATSLAKGELHDLDFILIANCRVSTFELSKHVTSANPPFIDTATAPFGNVKAVMLVVWKDGHAERVGVGEVVGSSWDAAGPRMKQVYLI